VASFYSRVLRRSNTGLCKEGDREVTDQRDGRAGVLTRATRHNSDVTVAAALRGGDAEGVCSYVIGSGELVEGGAGQGQAASECAPAHRGYVA
jgi:hypothetical protein